MSNVPRPERTCRITTCADPADRPPPPPWVRRSGPPTLAVLRSVADLVAAEASRGKGTPGRHMVERQAVEAPADQIRRNRAPGRPWAATESFGSQATFAHDQAESIRVHQRGCTKRAARQLRCRRTWGHSDRRASRGVAGSRLTRRPPPGISHESSHLAPGGGGAAGLDGHPLALVRRARSGPEQLLLFVLGDRRGTEVETHRGSPWRARGARSGRRDERRSDWVQGSGARGSGTAAGGAGIFAVGVGVSLSFYFNNTPR